MWTERPVLARNAKFGRGHVDAPSQFGELRSGGNPDPESSRSLRGREKSIAAGANFELPPLTPPQTFGNGLHPLRRLFSDELQRDVQRLRTHPARLRRKALNAF